jgi:hypothetical protein
MGQMQRRKRQFRESMRKDGEKVPSLRVASRRAMSIHFKKSAILMQAGMEVVRAQRAIRALKPSDDGSHKVEAARIVVAALEANIIRMDQAVEVALAGPSTAA